MLSRPPSPALALTVGEVARRSGVAISTVHFYETKGLIAGWRSAGNQRRFPRAVLRRIALIRIAQRAGVSLAQIRSALAVLPADRLPSPADWQRLSSGWRDDIEERIRRLTQLRDRFDDCIGCGCLSLAVCPLRNTDDRLGEVRGLTESRFYRAEDGSNAVLISGFESIEAFRDFQQSAAFQDVRANLLPLIERAQPGFYRLVHERARND